MGPFRVLQISIVVLMLFGSTWLVRIVGMEAAPSGGSSTWLSEHAALAGVLRQADNADNNGGDNNQGDNGGDNSGGGDNNADNNGGGDNNSNGNSNDNSFNDNDDVDFNLPPLLPSSSGPSQPPDPGCANPGQDATFFSRDGKVAVHIFPSTPQPVRVEILQVVDFLSAPLPPGNLVGLLAYEIRASHCDATPLAKLPAEANLGIHYTDLEATALDESRFVIGRLDMSTGTWRPLEKRGNDASSNFVSATIIDTGFYMVWETR